MNDLKGKILGGFEDRFRHTWFADQMNEERKVKWLPSKRPAQVFEEFLEYLWLIADVARVGAILEIGVAKGHQRRFYEQLLGCRNYQGVDNNPNTPATIHGESWDDEVVSTLREMEPDGWDVIFIDGTHSIAGVGLDYEIYSFMVKPGGFLAFHDIMHNHAEYCAGAYVLWPKIKDEYEKTWSIYHETDYLPYGKGTKIRKECGIGLIQMPMEEE